MSYFDSTAPSCAASAGEVELIIRPKRKDLGEFSVARALPSSERQMVGPFIFFDHMGPADFGPGQGIQVRPHPHIGIATITYLFEGLIMHRDSLGYAQVIEPGAVNLMVAGRGIVHSERAGDDLDRPSRLHGIQSWLALPDTEIEREPAFTHYPASEIPRLDIGGVRVRLIIGDCFGVKSPVASFAPTLYLEAVMPAGSRLLVPAPVPERAAYVVHGEISVDNEVLLEGTMGVLASGVPVEFVAARATRLMVLGGEPVGARELWWNFVAPGWDRIEQAKADWAAGRFDKIRGDEEFIPLPDD
jgi:redox-sensitive bicupin YhaK (pirin superfamily)